MIRDAASAQNYYGSRFAPEAGREGVWQAICDYLQPFIPSEAAVLDVGAGYCSFINHVRAAKKYALDMFPGFASYAQPDVQTYVGTCEDLSIFERQQLDIVFASNLFEHLSREAIDNTLSEIHRVLKPAGHLIIIQPNFRYCYRDYFDDYTHLQIFTERSLVDLLAAKNFIIERVEPKFIPFSFKSRLPKWPWLVNLYLKLPFRPLAGQMLVIGRVNLSPASERL